MLQYIEERLAELEGEKEELREYQQLDRDQRAIEYTIYDKELRGARQTLEKLDSARQEEAARRDKTHDASTEELMSELQSEHAKPVFDLIHFRPNPSKVSSWTTADLHQPHPIRATAAVCRRVH